MKRSLPAYLVEQNRSDAKAFARENERCAARRATSALDCWRGSATASSALDCLDDAESLIETALFARFVASGD